MASRIANKINRQALQNICKSLYSNSSESPCHQRLSSNDVTGAASTITSASTTINNKSNSIIVPQSTTTTGVAPLTTSVTNAPTSASSVQSFPCSTQNQSLNTPSTITNTQEIPGKDVFLTRIALSQMPPLSTAYQVCPMRPNTAPLNNHLARNQFNAMSFNKTVKVADDSLRTDHLQPGKQPEYYLVEDEDHNTPKASAEALKEAIAQGSSPKDVKEGSAIEGNGGYKKFQESMTYRNLTQPLKFSRLANPFPEPVKEMQSQKVTDQEKAAQMFAESRNNAMSQAHFAQRQKQLRLKPQVPIQPNFVRHYSDSARKCEVPKKKKTCKKIKTDKQCPPVNKSTSCKEDTYVYKLCKKKMAPYPSYSESCHDDSQVEKTCCPWMDEIHPAFKQKKKSYHTSTRALSLFSTAGISVEVNKDVSSHDMEDEVKSISDDTKGSANAMELKKRSGRKKPDCQSHPEMNKVPCAWVELDREEAWSTTSLRKKKPKPAKDGVTSKKEPCLPTSDVKCPPDANANLPADKRKRRSPPKKRAASVVTHDAEDAAETKIAATHIPVGHVATPVVGQSIDDWLAGLHPSKDETDGKVMMITAGGPCRKFPFKPQAFNLVVNRKPKVRPGFCPKKHKRTFIEDCPPAKKKCLGELLEDVLLFKGKDSKNSTKVPEGSSKSPDPCKKKRQPKSEICPDDLLSRKRKDKPSKKAMEYNEDFEEAVAMLDSIQRSRSAPSIFKPHAFKQ